MKKQLLFLSMALFGCNQHQSSSSSTNTEVLDDKRPKDELTLVKKLWDADARYKVQANDMSKQAVTDSAKADISNYLTNTINAEANNWIAYVGRLNAIGDVIEVKLWIPKEWNLGDGTPGDDAVNLSATIEKADTTVRKMFQPLKEGDRVIVSGTFTKMANKVNLNPASIHATPEYDLTKPEYLFTIRDIKKYQ